jgi:hypothetical protein
MRCGYACDNQVLINGRSWSELSQSGRCTHREPPTTLPGQKRWEFIWAGRLLLPQQQIPRDAHKEQHGYDAIHGEERSIEFRQVIRPD